MNDASVKSKIENVKYLLQPKSSDSIPLNGMMMTFDMAYAVMIQATSVVDAPMLPAMCLNDTLTTVESIISSRDAMIHVDTMIILATPDG
jgi:hypothetical protein